MPANVNPFATEEQWRAQGSPGGTYAAWLASIGYGPDGNPVASGTPSESLYNPDGSAKNGSAQPQRHATEADWVAAGRPGGSFEAWKAEQMAPQSFDQRMAAGEFGGREGEATQLEVRRRRRLLEDQGMKQLPPDVADIVLRDASGRVKRARAGSTQSALGAAFNSKSSLFGDA